MITEMPMTPRQWIDSFLEKEGKGRKKLFEEKSPLYKYRVDEKEFLDLQDFLQKLIKSNPDRKMFQNQKFSMLFVLYSAEWLRRKYDGTRDVWNNILKKIGLSSSDLAITDRGDMVNTGLRGWKQKQEKGVGRTYLGNIALQAGLPIQMLSNPDSSRRLTKILHQVINYSDTSTSEQRIRSLIDKEVDNPTYQLAESYKHTATRELLTQLVLAVVESRDEVLQFIEEKKLKQAPAEINPVAVLTECRGEQWHEDFPLSIEDRHADLLLRDLMSHAIKVSERQRRSRLLFPVERHLFCQQGSWQIQGRFSVTDDIPAEDLRQMFSLDERAELANEITLDFGAGKRVGFRTVIGNSELYRPRLGKRSFESVNESAISEYAVNLFSGQMLGTVTQPHGEALDENLPWIFDGAEGHIFLRQGGGSIPTESAIITIPSNMTVIASDAFSRADNCGLSTLGRNVWRISGTVGIYFKETNEVFSIRCGRREGRGNPALEGNRLWNTVFSSTVPVFSGAPILVREDDGFRRRTNDVLEWQIDNQKINNDDIFGPRKALIRNGIWKGWSQKVVVLPESCDFKIEFSKNANSPSIISFSNWELENVRSIDNKVEIFPKEGEKQEVRSFELKYKGKGFPPAECCLEVRWPNNLTPMCVQIPFPLLGIRAFTSEDRILADGSSLSLSDLEGLRIEALFQDIREILLTFELTGQNNFLNVREEHIPINVGENRSIIILNEAKYRHTIEELLSLSDDIDAKVHIDISLKGDDDEAIDRLRLFVQRYDCILDRSANRVVLSEAIQEGLAEVKLTNIRMLVSNLSDSSNKPVEIKSQNKNGVFHWIIPSASSPSAVIAYPHPESSLKFRPMVVATASNTVAEDITSDSKLSSVMAISDKEKRLLLLRGVVERLAYDFSDQDWADIDILKNRFSHLPLSALDIWIAFSRSPVGMAALALRCVEDKGLDKNRKEKDREFIIRFEEELPWLYEMVSLADWRETFGWYRLSKEEQIKDIAKIKPELFQRLSNEFENDYQKLVSELGSIFQGCSPILKYSSGLMSQTDDNENDKEIWFSRYHTEYTQMLQRHQYDNQPKFVEDIVSESEKQMNKKMEAFPTLYSKEISSIEKIPYLVCQASIDDGLLFSGNSRLMNILRQVKNYDKTWFENSYRLVAERFIYETWYEDVEKGRDIEACLRLGFAYFEGTIKRKDSKEAIKLWQKAIHNGGHFSSEMIQAIIQSEMLSGEICYQIGDIYANESPLTDKMEHAIFWWEKALNMNSEKALYKLEECYRLGRGIQKNEIRAHELKRKIDQIRLEQYKKQMDAESLYQKANEFLQSGDSNDRALGFEFMISAGERGHSAACYKLSSFYYGEKNFKLSNEWDRRWKLSKMGNPK